MELSIATQKGASGTVPVSEAVFAREFNEDLVHQAVVAYMAGGRQGSKAQKNRAAVSGGGKKPWRQKGTGRARAGTIRSPIWRSGGVTFAAVPRDHAKKINKKMYRAALKCIVSELARQDRLVVVDAFDVDAPRTKGLIEKMDGYKLDSQASTLIVASEVSENLYLSSRNLPALAVSDVEGINPVSLVRAEKVVMTVDAVKKINEALA